MGGRSAGATAGRGAASTGAERSSAVSSPSPRLGRLKRGSFGFSKWKSGFSSARLRYQMTMPVIRAIVMMEPEIHMDAGSGALADRLRIALVRSEEHTSELQSLMRISYAVLCLTKKKNTVQCTHSEE